ncbi:unnamed protein product [Prunus armeniaca]
MFTSIRIKEVSWTPELSAMSFWVSLLIRKATGAIILQPNVYMFLWMLPLLRMKCSSLIHLSMSFMGRLVVEPTTPAEPATLAEPATPTEPAILTDIVAVTESIAPHEASLIVLDQASLFYRLDGTVGLSLECKAFVTRMDSIKIPTHVEEAFKDPKWAEAMNIEMEALQKNNT